MATVSNSYHTSDSTSSYCTMCFQTLSLILSDTQTIGSLKRKKRHHFTLFCTLRGHIIIPFKCLRFKFDARGLPGSLLVFVVMYVLVVSPEVVDGLQSSKRRAYTLHLQCNGGTCRQ